MKQIAKFKLQICLKQYTRGGFKKTNLQFVVFCILRRPRRKIKGSF